MHKDNKQKIIVAGVIGIAFFLANLRSNSNIKDYFYKEDKQGIILDAQNAQIDQTDEISESLKDEKLDKKVHITGEINKPGVYIIDEGDRLIDLVEKAGGLSDKASEDSINLALILEDQMKIYIPKIDEVEGNFLLGSTNSNLYSDDDIGENNLEKVNLNTASKDELMTLPNIGEKRAETIIEYRQENRFEKIEDIKNVSGIGDKFFEAMKDLITV